MEREGVLERDVEIATPPRVVWGVKSITEIAAYHHHAYVDAQADTRAERDVAQERLAFKLAAGTQRVVLEQPDVARVNERRAMKDADLISAIRMSIFRIIKMIFLNNIINAFGTISVI